MAPQKKSEPKPRGKLAEARERIRWLVRERACLAQEILVHLASLSVMKDELAETKSDLAHSNNELKKVEGWYSEEKKKTSALEAEVARLKLELEDRAGGIILLTSLLRQSYED